MDHIVNMLLKGTVTELIIKLDPTIQKTHMVQQTWQTNDICTNKKAIYITIQASLLFWKLVSETLQEWGFTLNP